MSNHRYSSRAFFYVVVFVTLVLLVGSAILQRIVFKADQVSSAVFLTPSKTAIKPGEQLTVQVATTLGGAAVIAAGQFGIDFDPAVIAIDGVRAGAGFSTVKTVTDGALFSWAVTPAGSATADYNGKVIFGDVVMTAKKEGVATLHLNSANTVITAIDATQSPSLYNAVTSTQATAVTISADPGTASAALVVPDEPTEASDSVGQLQAIDEVIGVEAAELLISSKEPSAVTVHLGTDPLALSTVVESQKTAANTALRLANLEPGTKYYYRISIGNSSSANQIVSKIRSFTTLKSGSGSATISQLSALESKTKDQTTVYFVLQGNNTTSTDAASQLTITKGSASLSEITAVDGIYQATLTSKLTTKQTVTAVVTSGQNTLGSVSVLFDPNFTPKTTPVADTSSPLRLTPAVGALLAGLALALVLLLFTFFKLSRVK